MDRCALFVDAGYALADGAMAVHGTRRRDSVSWDHAGLLKLLAGLARDRTGLPVLRCYWYETAAEGRRTAEHDALAEMPGLKLRLFNALPGRREGIESQLRRDLVTLAKSGAISDAFIASANEHIAEIVAEVQDLGLRVVVLHIASDAGWTIPLPLRQECDDIVEISGVHLRAFVDLIRAAEPTPEESPISGYGAHGSADAKIAVGAALTHHGLPAAALPAPGAVYQLPDRDYRAEGAGYGGSGDQAQAAPMQAAPMQTSSTQAGSMQAAPTYSGPGHQQAGYQADSHYQADSQQSPQPQYFGAPPAIAETVAIPAVPGGSSAASRSALESPGLGVPAQTAAAPYSASTGFTGGGSPSQSDFSSGYQNSPPSAAATTQGVASQPGVGQLGQSQAGQLQVGQGYPGQGQLGQGQVGQGQPGQGQPGQNPSAQGQPGQGQPGQGQPGQSHPGQSHPGQSHPGPAAQHQGNEPPAAQNPVGAGQTAAQIGYLNGSTAQYQSGSTGQYQGGSTGVYSTGVYQNAAAASYQSDPGQNGAGHSGPAHSGPAHSGTAHSGGTPNGVTQSGTGQGGAGQGGAMQNGVGYNGAVPNGAHANGGYANGAQGPALSGSGQNGSGQNGSGQNGFPNGIGANGSGSNGRTLNGVGPNGVGPNGVGPNGVGQNGVGQNGMTHGGPNGAGAGNGATSNGATSNGATSNGGAGATYGYPGGQQNGSPGAYSAGYPGGQPGQGSAAAPPAYQYSQGQSAAAAQPPQAQPGNGQPGNGQPGNGQPGNGQPGPGQFAPGQFASSQFGPGQSGPAQGGPGQNGPAQSGMTGQHAPQRGGPQSGGPQSGGYGQSAGPSEARARDPYGQGNPQLIIDSPPASLGSQPGFGPGPQGFSQAHPGLGGPAGPAGPGGPGGQGGPDQRNVFGQSQAQGAQGAQGVGALMQAPAPGPLPAVRSQQPVAIALPDAVKAAHAEGFSFGESVGRDAPGLWLEAVLARKPRMPSDLEARLLQGSVLPIDSLLHDEVRHSLRRGFWDALESARR